MALDRIKNEPVLLLALVQAALTLFVAFGMRLTEEQMAGVLMVSGALLSIIARQSVTPTRKLSRDDADTDRHRIPPPSDPPSPPPPPGGPPQAA